MKSFILSLGGMGKFSLTLYGMTNPRAKSTASRVSFWEEKMLRRAWNILSCGKQERIRLRFLSKEHRSQLGQVPTGKDRTIWASNRIIATWIITHHICLNLWVLNNTKKNVIGNIWRMSGNEFIILESKVKAASIHLAFPLQTVSQGNQIFGNWSVFYCYGYISANKWDH